MTPTATFNAEVELLAQHAEVQVLARELEDAQLQLEARVAALMTAAAELHRLGLQAGLVGKAAELLDCRRLLTRYFRTRMAVMLPGSIGRLDRALREPITKSVAGLVVAIRERGAA